MKLCFLIPFYNHPEKIEKLVEILSEFKTQIFIIDDGSNEASKAVLQGLNLQENVEIFTREKNGGKGAAIKDGLNLALKKGFTNAFQIDADMQHDLTKIPTFIALSKQNPNALICGKSVFENAPKARLYGRKITDFWVWLNTLGGDIKESMCGFRVYPLSEICELLPRVKSDRMDFDIDILLHAYKKGIEFLWSEILVRYESAAVSHFRGFKDNALISLMHARHFLNLPFFAFKKFSKNLTKNSQNLHLNSKENSAQNSHLNSKENSALKGSQQWFEKNEKAGKFWLNLSVKLVSILPNFLLKIACFFVTLFYFIFSPKERGYIKEFYTNLREFQRQKGLKISKISVYRNFYEFGLSIADKIAVYKGKFCAKDLIIINPKLLFGEFIDKKEGQIILTSHFGNIEVARTLSLATQKNRLCVLVYSQNAANFMQLLNELNGTQIPAICVNELDLPKMLELKALLESGVHIGVMGDRSAISGKNLRVNFLTKECFLPQGAFLLAHLLKVQMSMLWCERTKKGYEVETQRLEYENKTSRDESIKAMANAYVAELERRVCRRPWLWFNFYDFWGLK